jgi:hypothetical protein
MAVNREHFGLEFDVEPLSYEGDDLLGQFDQSEVQSGIDRLTDNANHTDLDIYEEPMEGLTFRECVGRGGYVLYRAIGKKLFGFISDVEDL